MQHSDFIKMLLAEPGFKWCRDLFLGYELVTSETTITSEKLMLSDEEDSSGWPFPSR